MCWTYLHELILQKSSLKPLVQHNPRYSSTKAKKNWSGLRMNKVERCCVCIRSHQSSALFLEPFLDPPMLHATHRSPVHQDAETNNPHVCLGWHTGGTMWHPGSLETRWNSYWFNRFTSTCKIKTDELDKHFFETCKTTMKNHNCHTGNTPGISAWVAMDVHLPQSTCRWSVGL